MKTALTLALIGALAASPAFAAGNQQRSESQQQGMQSSGQMQHNPQTIRQVQQQLQQQGYDVQVDGQWGPKSRQALTEFQQKQGMRANGRLDQQTLAALGVNPSGTQQAQTPEEQRQQQQQQQRQPSQRQGGGGSMDGGMGAPQGGQPR